MRHEWWIVGGVLAIVLAASRSARAATANADEGDSMTNIGVTPGVRDLATAIGHAEGFGIAGTIPTRANNPGDLVIPGWKGATLGDQRISVFASPTEGWNRLYRQLDLIANERSHVYTLDDSFADLGAKWTQTQVADWTNNVLAHLVSKGYDVTADTTLREFFDL